MEKSHAFHTLDALRGIAALAVMQFHMAGFFGGKIFPQGYLAVDFFFQLSGFVLAFAYQKNLDGRWGTGSFLLVRFVRLYPMYLMGLLLGSVLKLMQVRFGSVHPTAEALLGFVALGLLVLPAPPGLQAYGPSAFPLNPPTWSLFFEAIANVLHGLLLRRRSTRFLGWVAAVCAGATVSAASMLGTMDFGWKRAEVLYGVPRVLFSYTIGMLLFRAWQLGRVRVRVHPLWIAAGLVGLLAIPVSSGRVAVYSIIVTMCVFPLLLLIAAWSETTGRLASLAGVLGMLSYPLYVLHEPLGEIFDRAWLHVYGHAAAVNAPWPGVMYAVFAVALALLITRFYDLPVRSFLRRQL